MLLGSINKAAFVIAVTKKKKKKNGKKGKKGNLEPFCNISTKNILSFYPLTLRVTSIQFLSTMLTQITH